MRGWRRFLIWLPVILLSAAVIVSKFTIFN